MATSPPAWDAPAPGTPSKVVSPVTQSRETTPAKDNKIHEPARKVSVDATVLPKREPDPALANDPKDNYVSKISILTSSLPFYHNQFMERQREAKRRREAGDEAPFESDGTDSKDVPKIEGLTLDPEPRLQTPAEQAETARRLKPISLSTLQLQSIIALPLTQVPEETKQDTKKHKTRWQFGIRSRNLPHEAMHCVYKALLAMGAEWELPNLPEDPPGGPLSSYPVHVEGAMRLEEAMHPSRAPSPEVGRKGHVSHDAYAHARGSGDAGGPGRNTSIKSSNTDDDAETDDDDIDPSLVPAEYIPKDPWVIHARWLKKDMLPAGVAQSISANSSRQDLTSNPASRRTSLIGSNASNNTSKTDMDERSESKTQISAAAGACYVYMDIQLYTLDASSDKTSAGTYLVDFKCAGYEPVLEKTNEHGEKEFEGVGYRIVEKDVTSPQPFLDMTNKLVIHLAGGGSSGS